MSSFFRNKKFVLTIIVSGLLIGIGFLGGNWQIGKAQTNPTNPTNPTVPTVLTLTPNEILRNSVDIPFVITGTNFIGDPWSVDYTLVIFTAPDGRVYYGAPDSISADGTSMVFTVPSEYLNVQGIGTFYIDNHPDEVGELAGPLYLSIIDFLYLPFLAK